MILWFGEPPQWYPRHSTWSSGSNFIYRDREDDRPPRGNNHKDGSGPGFYCLSDPNAWPCHLSVRQRPLLLAQVSAKFPTHSIWNVVLAMIVLPKPLPTELLFIHT